MEDAVSSKDTPVQDGFPGERRYSAVPCRGLVTGRVAFVTGAGSGIGRATCEVLAREGARVVATDVDGESVRRTVSNLPAPTQGGEHRALQLDVRDEDAVMEAVGAEPGVSIAVSCAGIMSDRPVLEMNSKDFQDMLDVNLKVECLPRSRSTVKAVQAFHKANIRLITHGTLHVTRAAGRVMLCGVGGAVVNVSSMVASSGYPGLAHYSASKAAVEALTKSSACEWGRKGVRCNVVQPGLIDTPLARTYRGRVWCEYRAKNALGRPGSPHEVAEMIVFLASDRSSYVNGATIDITGGFL